MTVEDSVSAGKSASPEAWRDPAAGPDERMRGVRALLEQMTVREKAAQLYAIWMGVDDADEIGRAHV